MNIDDNAMKPLVAKAIFDTITHEQRTALLQDAIVKLLNPSGKKDYYGNPEPSALHEIFTQEVRNLARDVVRSEFQTNEAIKKLVADASTKALAKMAETFALSDQIAIAIVRAFERANSRD